jgi:hypothetical protein
MGKNTAVMWSVDIDGRRPSGRDWHAITDGAAVALVRLALDVVSARRDMTTDRLAETHALVVVVEAADLAEQGTLTTSYEGVASTLDWIRALGTKRGVHLASWDDFLADPDFLQKVPTPGAGTGRLTHEGNTP